MQRADQLAALKQGPPNTESVRPEGRTAGVGPAERDGVMGKGMKILFRPGLTNIGLPRQRSSNCVSAVLPLILLNPLPFSTYPSSLPIKLAIYLFWPFRRSKVEKAKVSKLSYSRKLLVNHFHYWIQRHDYSSDEKIGISVGEAIQAFTEFDWAEELAMLDDSEQGKNCPPGIGIHNGFNQAQSDAVLLHICPKDQSQVFLNFHYKIPKKMFGLIRYHSDAIQYVESYSRNCVENLIRLLFELRVNDILDDLRNCGH